MTKATSISDILAVQGQLNTLQSQIEQLQGQLNVLNHETTFSSLTVALTEAGHSLNAPHQRSGLEKAWHDAVSGFVAGFEWLIRISGPALFVVLLLGLVLALGRVGWRATNRRRM
jgi:phosphoglycerol transferase MdoB-like AlkP superfamily enzyme